MSNSIKKEVSSNSGQLSRLLNVKLSIPLLLKSAVIAVSLIILGSSGINILVAPQNSGGNFLNSIQSLINFIILFAILLIYDKITTKWTLFYQEVIAAIFLDFFVCFGLFTNGIFLFLSFLIAFLLTLFGSLAGQKLYEFGRAQDHLTAFKGAIVFLIVIWAVYIIVFNYSSLLSSVQTNFGGNIATVISNGNPTGPYLSPNDLNSIFGFGLYSASSLNPSEVALGNGTGVLFRTPIQHLLFNFTLKNISVQSVNYVEFYNPYNVTFNETLIQTNQASFILVTAARSAKILGQVGGTSYFAVTNFIPINDQNYSDSDTFIMGAQKAGYLATISCSGRSCNPITLNNTINRIASDLKNYN